MEWDENEKGKHWRSGDYTIRFGDNEHGAKMPGAMANVYHCYFKGMYISQANTLNDAKKDCKTHRD